MLSSMLDFLGAIPILGWIAYIVVALSVMLYLAVGLFIVPGAKKVGHLFATISHYALPERLTHYHP